MRQVIDTLGGVDVDVERTINDPQYHDTLTLERGLYIEAGVPAPRSAAPRSGTPARG